MRRLLLFLSFTFWFGALPAQESQNNTVPVENRFLFVLETSSAMDRSSKSAVGTILNLVSSGVQGQMKPGDTFGLWTFNDKLDTSFPMQRWTPAESEKLAEMTGSFLKQRRYEKKANVNGMLGPLYSVIRSSRAITVVLVSTGHDPIQGTPFDNQINSIYPMHARELRKERLVFVTILVGRNGRLVAHSVNSALGPIRIPNPPIEPLPIAKPKTNVMESTSAATNKVVQPTPRKIARSNIIITKETIARESAPPAETKSVAPQTSAVATRGSNAIPPAPSDATEPKIFSDSTKGQTTQANPPSVEESLPKTSDDVVTNSPFAIDSANSIDTLARAGQTKPANLEEQISKAQETSETGSPLRETNAQSTVPIDAEQTLVVTQYMAEPVMASAETKGNRFLAIGLALAGVAIVLIFLIARSARRRTGPSIISSSMDGRR